MTGNEAATALIPRVDGAKGRLMDDVIQRFPEPKGREKKGRREMNLLCQLANPEDLLAARGACPLDRRPAVLQFDLLGILDLPILLLLVYAVSCDHCELPRPEFGRFRI
jgi:hypothetical protein